MAQRQVALQLRAAQVEVAVLEADVLGRSSISSSIGKGGVFASDRTRISRASTSTSPVASFGFTVSAERADDLADHGDHVLARAGRPAACAVGDTSGRATTWQIPSRSRRSMKTTPPWSRRVAAQPIRVTVWPTCSSRSAPQ